MQRCVGGGAAALFTAKIISQCFMDSTFQLISDTERSITSETANWYRVAHTQYFTLYFFLQLHPPQFHVHPHETANFFIFWCNFTSFPNCNVSSRSEFFMNLITGTILCTYFWFVSVAFYELSFRCFVRCIGFSRVFLLG
jgi:hypothetical protein